MTERETEFDFDFFEEPETQEAPARARPTRGPRRPPMRPPGGFTPLLRLVGLIAFAIAAIVVLVLVVQSCRGDDERALYASYVDDVRPIARNSAAVGRQLSGLLTTPTIRLAGVRERLDALVQQQAQDVANAEELTPPGHLREQHRQLTDALELRGVGLERLRETFRNSGRNRRPAVVGRELSADMSRFVASDVLWEDGFRQGSIEILRREGVDGVDPPRSRFLRDLELASAGTLSRSWQRIRGTTIGRRGPGPHGNALVGVRVLPGGEQLRADLAEPNVVIASAELAFQVSVENSGNSQGVRVRVRLRVDQQPNPVDEERVIPVINPGQTKTVTFRNISQIVKVETPVPVRVEVVPVPGEERTENNSATYRVLFRLSG